MGLPSMLINPLILIAAIFLSAIIFIFYHKYYQPYFFPNLDENKDVNEIIKLNNTYVQDLLLIKGIMSMDTKSSVTFYTANKRSPEYVRFFPSINKDGGNQYTYTFWFNKKKNNYKNKTLFYRGNIEGTTNKPSPKVGFGKNSDELVIDFQTNKEGEVFNKKSTIKNKLFDITDHDTWYMITIILKDYKDFKKRNFENGVELSVYLNDVLLEIARFEGETLRITNNKFVILPDAGSVSSTTNIPGEIADIRYFNYALSHQEIIDLYNKNFNNEVFKTYLQLNTNKSKQNLHKINMFNRLRT
tara:strand:+ start:2807 stop:3709 length:903 start_codon:yes stop_codon:yes gene_type:complete